MGRVSMSNCARLPVPGLPPSAGARIKKPGRTKRSLIRVLGPVMVLAVLPVLGLQSPSQAATTRAVDGLSQATAAGSCWEIKQSTPSAPSGVYWLVTPALVAPEQFYCDQSTDGGGWVLVGRGRQGWKADYQGLGSAATLRNTITGPAAFAPVQLPALTVDGLLNKGAVSALAEGVRLRRAADRSGSTWQEVRFKMVNRSRWQWTFGAQHVVGAYSFSGAGGSGSSSGGQTVSFGTDQAMRRVNTQAPEAQGYLWGFAYGSSSPSALRGTSDPESYIWSNTDNTSSGRPFTQMFLRPQLRRDTMFTGSIADGGTSKQEVRALPDSNATRTVWGVNGLADGIDNELHTEVQDFAQIGQTMFVGGNFRYVQKDAAGTGRVPQSYLAGFNVTSGELVNPTGFDPTFNGQVKALSALPDGRLAVGGEFSTVNGQVQPGLAFLDPETGDLSGPQVYLERRQSGGGPTVRGLDTRGGFLYVAGSFTHLVQGSTAASAWNGGRINVATSSPDTNWNPVINGTSVGINVSSLNDRAYFAGYFTSARGQSVVNVTALATAAGAPLALGAWQAHSSANLPNRFWQFAVQEVGDRFYYGGSQHSIFGYDRNAMDSGVKSGSITLSGGDFQTLTANENTVFGGCHCGHYNYQDVYHVYPNVTGFTQADAINTFGAWNSADGTFLPEFNPIVKGRKGYGAWGMMQDSLGRLWVGGDYATSIRAGYVNQWSGGFMRYAPRDTQAPSTPTNFAATNIDTATFRLSWNASADNAGTPSYEVLEGNRVIATTTTTSAVINRLSGTQRYFVRAVDATANRSASTAVLNVADIGNQPPPAAPVVTGQALSATSVRLTWPTQPAAGGFIVKRDDVQVGTPASGATSFDDTGLAADTTYSYTVTAVDDLGQQTSSSPVQVTTLATPPPSSALVEPTTPWRWRFADTAPANGWAGAAFDDSSWSSGTGPFGFGSTLVNTDVSVGAPSPRPLSAQFRTSFEVADVNAIASGEFSFVADDGVVVYLNGVEVARRNLPAGTITSTTYATAAPRSAASNADPMVVSIPASALVNGTNVVAAQTHLNYRGTPDALFRLTLSSTPREPGGDPPPPAVPVVTGQALSATSIRLTWPDQEAAGGFIVKRDDVQVGTPASGATSFTDTGLTPETAYSYTVTAVDNIGQLSTSAPVQVTTPATPPPSSALVGSDTPWRWRYASTAPDNGWAGAVFDDSGWSSGTGPFGFGSTLVNTDIGVGAPSPRPLTAQFRTSFEVADVGALGAHELTFVADDGVVVYLNGVEVARQNLPAGTITSTTYATSAPRSATTNANPVVVSIPASMLVNGTNVVAAQTHLNYRGTPDALFRLTLTPEP